MALTRCACSRWSGSPGRTIYPRRPISATKPARRLVRIETRFEWLDADREEAPHTQISDFINVEDSQISINRSLALTTIVDPRIQQPYPAAKKKQKPKISRSPVVDRPAH